MTLESNAEELALIAQEIGAEVIRGPVRYPSETGDIEVGGVDTGGVPVPTERSRGNANHSSSWPCGGTGYHLWSLQNVIRR